MKPVRRVLVLFLLIVFLLISPAGLAVAATRTWDGGGTGNNWSTAENWSDDTVPATTDDVVFDNTSTKNATINNVGTWSGGTLWIKSGYTGTLTQSAALIIASTTQNAGTWDGGNYAFSITGDLTVAGGTMNASSTNTTFGNLYVTSGTFSQIGSSTIAITGDAIFSGGTVKHADNSNAEINKLVLNIGDDFTLGASGLIDVSGLGYDVASGPGKSSGVDAMDNPDGGSYGGIGGDGGGDGIGGPTYGSIIAPTNLGSGSCCVIIGGAGGGAIIITAIGDSIIDGIISADGSFANNLSGGSGGSVFLTTGTIAGAGTIRANGGLPVFSFAGGGGGRVALILTGGGANFSNFSGAITAYGATGETNAQAGAGGTVYKQTTAQGSAGGQLTIDSNNLTPSSWVVTDLNGYEATSTAVGSIVLQNKGRFTVGSDDTLTTNGTGTTITINSGTTLINNYRLFVGGTAVTNSGTWTNASSSLVTFTGQSDDSAVTINANPYGKLTLNNTGTTFNAAGALTIYGTTTISAGTFDVTASNYGLTVGNDWVNSGTFTARSGTVTFATSTGAYTLTGGGSAFYNIVFDDSGGSGTWQLGGALDVDNNLTITGGALDANGKAITLAGTWTNNDTFTANANTVTLDGGSQTINNSNTFYNLTKSISSGGTLTFAAGTTQTITSSLSLSGAANNLLSLRSSSDGSTWYLNPPSGTRGDYLSVKDSTNLGSSEIDCRSRGCEDAGNNSGWLFDVADVVTGGSVSGLTRLTPKTCSDPMATLIKGQCVTPPPVVIVPILDLTANDGNGPLRLQAPTTINLVWRAANVETCLAAGNGWSGVRGVEGSEIIDLPTGGPRTFWLICTGTKGTVSDHVVVIVTPPPPVPGCTDKAAQNYNPAARQNDGTCKYETEPPVVITPPKNQNDNNDVTTDAGSGPEGSATTNANQTITGPGQETPTVSTTSGVAIIKPLATLISTAATRAVKPVALGAGLLAGAIPLVAVSGQIFSLYDLYLILARSGRALLSLLGLRKRSPAWGVVYDAVTKRPIDPALVSVLAAGSPEALVATAITDLDGRYGFLLPAGAYKLETNKTHYRFPSRLLAGHHRDEIYSDLYFGERLVFKQSDLVTKNIPLDPVNFDWNEFIKEKLALFKISERRRWLVNSAMFLIYLIGFALAAEALWRQPDWLNASVIIIYVAVFAGRRWWESRHRILTARRRSGELFSFAVIRAYVEGIDKPVRTVVTDVAGRFYLLLRPGTYYLTVEEKTADGSYREVHRTKPRPLPDGLLTESIVV